MSRGGTSRHRSREVALQVLYAIDIAERGSGASPTPEETLEGVAAHFELPEGARAFAKELVAGVGAHREALDARIAEHARHWRLSRMAAVDRNVLRLAVYELEHGDTPASVILDEAVELARRFGDDPSPAFVNGVLDAVARSVRGDELRDAPAAATDERERMRRMIRGYVRFVARNPEFVRMMHDEGKRRGARMRWLVDRHVRPLYEALGPLLRRAQEQGIVPSDIAPVHLHYILVGSVGLFFHQAEECRRLTGIDPAEPAAVEAHARAVERLFLGRPVEEHSR